MKVFVGLLLYRNTDPGVVKLYYIVEKCAAGEFDFRSMSSKVKLYYIVVKPAAGGNFFSSMLTKVLKY